MKRAKTTLPKKGFPRQGAAARKQNQKKTETFQRLL
jgi:hypothetical protein